MNNSALAMLSMFAGIADYGGMSKSKDAGPRIRAKDAWCDPPVYTESKRKQKKRQGKQSRAKRKKGKRNV